MGIIPWGWDGRDLPLDLTRWRFARGAGWGAHSHAFHECFWIERGRCRHRVDGIERMLVAGDCAFLVPGHDHLGEAASDELVLINLAIRSRDLHLLRRRHPDLPLWDGAAVRRLPPAAIEDLGLLVDAIDPASAVDRDLLLLHLARHLRHPGRGQPHRERMPGPLAEALAGVIDRGAWDTGVSALAAACGWGREHLARTVRSACGTTPTRLLQDLRLDAAARALRVGGAPILRVALDHGFGSLAHFYETFRARFGCSPGQWRRLRRGDMPGGALQRSRGWAND